MKCPFKLCTDTNTEIVNSGLADVKSIYDIPKNKQIGSCVNEYLTSFGFGYDVTTCHMSCNALFPQTKCLSNNRRYPHLNAGKNAWF